MRKKLTSLERDIAEIKARNARVERDKAWEVSKTRKTLIFLATYACIALLLLVIGVPDPLLNAAIPAVAFVLSTLSLSFAREVWEGRVYKE
ncbi:MAG: hypothetical protein WC588_03380 [Candidatus Micrarchaeia archaeon]